MPINKMWIERRTVMDDFDISNWKMELLLIKLEKICRRSRFMEKTGVWLWIHVNLMFNKYINGDPLFVS